MLKIKDMNLNNVIRQGDSQPREYQLDTGNLNLNLTNKSATIRLMTADFQGIGYETTATVSGENKISFSIDDVIPARQYRLEVTVDDYVFPSRATDGRFDIDPSSHGQEVKIIQVIGKDEIVRDVKARVENELEPLVTSLESAHQAELDRQAQEEARVGAESARETNEQTRLNKDLLRDDKIAQMEADKDAVIANATVDSEVILARGGKATLGQRLDETTAQLAHTETQLEDMGINVRKYGAISDGVFHSIRDKLPNVTLVEVQALNPNATLDNSVDWYAIQKALKENATVRVAGDCVLDLPITITSNNKRLISENGKAILRNVGENIDTIVIGGNDRGVVYNTRLEGITFRGNRKKTRYGIYLNNVSNLKVEDCEIYSHEYGVYSANNNSAWDVGFKKCVFQNNKKGGVKLKNFYEHQKNAIAFGDCLISHNGYDESDRNLYHANERTFDFGHGIEVSGTALSVTNSTIEMNSGAGLLIGGDGQQDVTRGVNVSGCYFEPNLLADIFIVNEVQIFEGNINGNYLGADTIEGALYKGVHIKQRGNVSSSSNINNNNHYLTTKKDYFNHNGEVKLNQNRTTRYFSPFLFKRGQYELNVDFDWNKVTSNSQCRFGLRCLDYDGNELHKDTTPSYVKTPYVTLVEDVEESSTVLKFDDLTGFDISESNYDWLVVYDTVLSTGKVIGTEYSTTFRYKSLITIDVSSNTITLSSPIGKNIKSGTKASLNSASGTSALLSSYLTVSDDVTKRARRTFNTENLSYEKHVYYLRPIVELANANNVNDELSILRLSYDKKPFEIINEDWKSVSPINGWTGGISYRKNVVGQLELRGNPFGGTRSANTVLFTLPEGYRGTRIFNVGGTISGNVGVGVANLEIISSSGEVKLRNNTDLTQLNFDGTIIPL